MDASNPDKPGESSASTPTGTSIGNVAFASIVVTLDENAVKDWLLYDKRRRRRKPSTEETIRKGSKRSAQAAIFSVLPMAGEGSSGRGALRLTARDRRNVRSRKRRGTMIHQEEIRIDTQGHRDMHDLTPEVHRIVQASGVQTGLAHAFSIGSTATVGTIEFEPGLERDLPEMLDRLIPRRNPQLRTRAGVARRQRAQSPAARRFWGRD